MFFTEDSEVLMSKITEQDRQLMVKHLRELSKLSMKANIKHHTVLDKLTTHQKELMNMLKEERASNQRLKNIISYRDEEIEELNQKNTDLLWDAAKLEERIACYEKEKKNDEIEAAQFQKKLVKHYKKESVEN